MFMRSLEKLDYGCSWVQKLGNGSEGVMDIETKRGSLAEGADLFHTVLSPIL